VSESTRLSPLEWFRFELDLEGKTTDLDGAYNPIRDILTGFHPHTHPVLWRAFIAFFLLSEFYIHAREFTIQEYDACTDRVDAVRFQKQLDKEIRSKAMGQHFEAARLYVRGKLISAYGVLLAAG
jgi:hypothetical protein